MPDRDLEAPPHARLRMALIWAGVGLAPVAALVVLLGGSENSIRFAVLLIAVCVVLIGAALLIRDPALLGADDGDRTAVLREEIAAGSRALGQRVQALQDELTRMRAAGSPALAPAAGRAGAAAPVSAGRSAVASAFVAPPEGHTSVAQIPPVSASLGRKSGSAAVSASGGRTSASAAVSGASGRMSASAAVSGAAGRIPASTAGSASVAVASASVGAAAVGSDSAWSGGVEPGAAGAGSGAVGFGAVGARAAGSASVGAAAAPRQRGAAVVHAANGGGYQGEYGTGASHAVSDYGLGSSGSAWAERSGAVEHGGHADSVDVAQAKPRQSRRHAAPDTGTDIARFGLDDSASPESQAFDAAGFGQAQAFDVAGFGEAQGYDAADIAQAHNYDAAGFAYDAVGMDDEPGYGGSAGQGYGGTEYGLPGGYDQTGEAAWTGHRDYNDGYAAPAPRDWPATGGFGSAASTFFPEEQDAGGYPPPTGRAVTYGLAMPAQEPGVYGRDPMAAPDGWAPRSHEQPGRW